MTENEQKQLNQRRFSFMMATIFIFVVILGKFFYVQILGSEEHFKRSEANRTRAIEITPTRGLIYDRNQRLLVDNIPAYSISVIPYELEKKDFLLNLISERRPYDLPTVQEKLRNALTPYQPLKILSSMDHSELTFFVENRLDLPGVISQVEPQRDYPSKIRASHFLGFIREIDEREIESKDDAFYKSGDIVGKSGLEKYYEYLLRGEKGYKFMVVDVFGREVGEINTPNSAKPIPGNNLILTIDHDLQKKSEELLGDSLGAIIALNPQNGEIYAAVSKPDYDLLFMSGHFTQREFNEEILNNPGYPLYNRVSQGEFPPGSTYKIIGAFAALNDNVISEDQTYTCKGSFKIPGSNKIHYCWKRDGHGTLDLIGAIEQSCNVYFYNVSQKLTLEQWSYYGALFQFGQKTGIDIPEEKEGVLPTKDYMDNKYDIWVEKGQMAILIIGQGDMLATPLQMARFAAAIGTKGKLVQPHFLKAAVDSKSDSVVFAPELETTYITEIRDEVWDAVRKGMYKVVNGESGTARTVRHPEVAIAGKTGTSENLSGQDHAWFIGYAPEENPTIALAVFVENGGGGGRVAAPLAREIFKEYFKLEKMRKNTARTAQIK